MDTRAKNILDGILKTKRVAGGYIFSGSDNPSKLETALYFAQALNCASSPTLCGTCVSCKKLAKNVHPDIIVIKREKATLKIEQIRALKEITRYGPAESNWQVIIINEADTLTTEAANSFLKVLEEPPPQVVFILIVEREGNLPKTVESRCQKVLFGDPETREMPEDVMGLFRQINQFDLDYIDLSQALAEIKDVRGILAQFFTLFVNAKKIKQARAVLETLKGVERNANQRLALDLLCLNLWKRN